MPAPDHLGTSNRILWDTMVEHHDYESLGSIAARARLDEPLPHVPATAAESYHQVAVLSFLAGADALALGLFAERSGSGEMPPAAAQYFTGALRAWVEVAGSSPARSTS